MKKMGVMAAMVGLSVAIVVIAAPYTTGWGRQVTASSTTTRIASVSLNLLSVENRGSETVYVLVNATTNEFNVAITNTSGLTPVPVPAGGIYTFDMATKGVIYSFCYATTNSTADVYFGGL